MMFVDLPLKKPAKAFRTSTELFYTLTIRTLSDENVFICTCNFISALFFHKIIERNNDNFKLYYILITDASFFYFTIFVYCNEQFFVKMHSNNLQKKTKQKTKYTIMNIVPH